MDTTWTQLWSMINCCDDRNTRQKWELAIGYWIEPETDKPRIDPKLDYYLNHCSIKELVEFLSGAPLPLARQYISLLPDQKLARKVALCFRKEDLPALSDAYYHPRPLMIEEPKK